MSKRARVTPEIILRVKEIKDNHPEMCHWEIGKQVGVSDETVRCILHNKYQIAGDTAVRIYKKPKKETEKTDSEQNVLNMYPNTDSATKQLLNALYSSNKAFSVTLNDICEVLKQIREAITDLRDMLKEDQNEQKNADNTRAD